VFGKARFFALLRMTIKIKRHPRDSVMRKLLVFNLVTLDGYFEGPNRDISWHNVDAEFNEYAIDMLNSVDTLIFGRVTYELMAGYWPNPDAIKNDPIVAGKMNALPKIVFSRTLNKVEWNNTRLLKEVVPKEIETMKQASGKDMMILGSGSIMSEFANQGLIDGYGIMVNPIILGNGTPMFKGIKDRMKLKLVKARTFRNGNVLLYYQPDKA
jgi:dihydrofolate reductase